MSIFSRAEEKNARARLNEIDNVRGRGGDADGRLTHHEFCSFMLEYMRHLTDKAFEDRIASWEANLKGSHRKLLLRRVFSRMDVDRSGTVTIEEFRALNDAIAADSTNSAAAVFAEIEAVEGNGDGELTSDEWVPFVLEQQAGRTDEEFHALVDGWLEVLESKKRETLLRQAFAKMDNDGSGTVSLEEFENLKEEGGDNTFLLAVYQHLDTEYGDGDGDLSVDEWIRGMTAMGEDMDDEAFEAQVAMWMENLAKNHRKVWRGCHERGHAHELVIAARAAGATHFLFVQHANLADAAAVAPPPTLAETMQEEVAPDLTDENAPSNGVGVVAVTARPVSGGVVPLSSNRQLEMTQISSQKSLSRGRSSPSLLTPRTEANSASDAPARNLAGQTTQMRAGGGPRLSDRGTAMCMLARDEWFGRMPVRQVVLCAPALCTRETAMHMLGNVDLASELRPLPPKKEDAGTESAASASAAEEIVEVPAGGSGSSPHELTLCPALSPSEATSECGVLVANKSGAEAPLPLRHYLDADGGERALSRYAEEACEALTYTMRRGLDSIVDGVADETAPEAPRPATATGPGRKKFERATYYACVGHPVYMAALAHAVGAASGMRPAELDALIELEVGEAEGILIPLYGLRKSAVHLKRPK